MNILDRRHTWLHTHFLTDCERLPPHRIREIESQIIPVLRNLGIVYDIHFAIAMTPAFASSSNVFRCQIPSN